LAEFTVECWCFYSLANRVPRSHNPSGHPARKKIRIERNKRFYLVFYEDTRHLENYAIEDSLLTGLAFQCANEIGTLPCTRRGSNHARRTE
jgi:hypothetical protein